MGYKIQYSTYSDKKFPVGRRRKRKYYIIIAGVLILAILIPVYKSGLLKDLLVPGDAAVTEAAVEMLADELKEGVPLKDAVATFCREIIYHGQTY